MDWLASGGGTFVAKFSDSKEMTGLRASQMAELYTAKGDARVGRQLSGQAVAAPGAGAAASSCIISMKRRAAEDRKRPRRVTTP